MREEVRRLIAQAERDLENARRNLDIEAYEVSAFLCQQSVEKLLKAVIMHTTAAPPPHTHNLLDLAKVLGGAPSGLRPRLFYLNLDYTVSRYPDAANGIPFEQYDRGIAEEKRGIAQEAFTWLRTLL